MLYPSVSMRTAVFAAALLIAPVAAAQRGPCPGESTVEMAECAAQELRQADAALNVAFQQALRALERSEIGGMSGTRLQAERRRAVAALRRGQRAWITVRDETCDGALPLIWGGGTGTGTAVLTCKKQATEHRTQELRDAFFN